MASRQYTVSIKIRDSPELRMLQKLESEGIKMGGQMSKFAGLPTGQFGALQNDLLKESKGHTSLFQKLTNLSSGQLLKTIGIGAGITALVGIMAKASPMLSGVFKLFETTFFLFLRPFGNLLAFALLPLAMLLLRSAVMFNTLVGPAMIKLGKDLGPSLANLLSPAFWQEAITNPIGVLLQQGIPGIGTLGDAIKALTAALTFKSTPPAPAAGFKSDLFRRPFEEAAKQAGTQPGGTFAGRTFQPSGGGAGLFESRKTLEQTLDKTLGDTPERRMRGSRGGGAPVSFTMNVANFSGAFAELQTAQNKIGSWITNKLKELGVF